MVLVVCVAIVSSMPKDPIKYNHEHHGLGHPHSDEDITRTPEHPGNGPKRNRFARNADGDDDVTDKDDRNDVEVTTTIKADAETTPTANDEQTPTTAAKRTSSEEKSIEEEKSVEEKKPEEEKPSTEKPATEQPDVDDVDVIEVTTPKKVEVTTEAPEAADDTDKSDE
jgi:hypothetical protein